MEIKKELNIDVNNNEFLEYYGALLGDGWLTTYISKIERRRKWVVGICGNSEKDKEYLINYIRPIIQKLFNRKGTIKYHKDNKEMEIVFGHKELLYYLNKEFKFPIGLKKVCSYERI